MHEIIDKILSTVEKTAKVVVQKSTDIVDITKTRYAIMSEEGKSSDIIKDIGQLVYDAYKSGDGNADAIAQKCSDLDLLVEAIEQKKDQLAKLRNLKRCTECGNANEMAAMFCNRCGEKLPEVEVEQAEDIPGDETDFGDAADAVEVEE